MPDREQQIMAELLCSFSYPLEACVFTTARLGSLSVGDRCGGKGSGEASIGGRGRGAFESQEGPVRNSGGEMGLEPAACRQNSS